MLWKLREANAYILGSFHFGPPGGFPLEPKVLAAFDAAKDIYFEVTPDQLALTPELAKRQGGSLKEELGEVLYEKLIRDPRYNASFESVQLFFAMMQLTLPAYTEIGLSHENGVDRILFSRANENQQRILGLETAADQVASFCSIPKSQIATMTGLYVENPRVAAEVRDILIGAYLNGDESALSNIRQMIGASSQEFVQGIFLKREAAWLAKIRSAIASKRSIFVVAGVLHMTGVDALIERLKHLGFTVDRM